MVTYHIQVSSAYNPHTSMAVAKERFPSFNTGIVFDPYTVTHTQRSQHLLRTPSIRFGDNSGTGVLLS